MCGGCRCFCCAKPSQATDAHRCQACPDMRPSPACLLIISTHPPHRPPTRRRSSSPSSEPSWRRRQADP
jgi:hypothetical protein